MSDTTPGIILPSSPEAATLRTITGWVARGGEFWGDDERMARWVGATHLPCADCNVPLCRKTGNSTLCKACAEKRAIAAYFAAPRIEWNGDDLLYSDRDNEYFSDQDELEQHMLHHDATFDELRVYICEPQYAREIDSSYWEEEMASDDEGDLPTEIADALSVFNAVIKAYDQPLSWVPGLKVPILTLPGGAE